MMEIDARRPVVLGIDWGSTCVRAALYDPKDDLIEVINFHGNDFLRSTTATYNHDEVPSSGQPYQAPYDVGEKAYNAPGSESLKIFMYALTGKQDLLKVDIGLLQGVPRDRLSSMLFRFFSRVRRQIDKFVYDHNMRYTRIALTIPSFWDEKFQEHYNIVISGVWEDWKDSVGSSPDSISFVTEIEAQAHSIIRTMPQKLKTAEEVLFIDLGGHSMARETGGEEVFARLIGKNIDAELDKRRFHHNRHRERCKADLIKSFHRVKGKIASDLMSPITLRKGTQEEMEISGDILLQRQNETYDDILKSIDLNAQRMTQDLLGNGNAPVAVFTGGSFNSTTLQSAMLDISIKYNLEAVFLNIHDTALICKGAALAIGKEISVSDFINSGAGFGIRVGEMKTAYILRVHQDGVSETVEVKLTRSVELMLVCDPLYRIRKQDLLHCNYCYDVRSLGKKSRGVYQFKIHWKVSSEGNSSFEVIERRVPRRGRIPERMLKLPLYFDGGNNCCHVDKSLPILWQRKN